MYLKNNSKNNWPQYNCGTMCVDIMAGDIIEVPDAIGELILKNLGSPNWVTKTEKPEVKTESIVSKIKTKKIKK